MAFLFRKKPPNLQTLPGYTPPKAAMSQADLLDAAKKGNVAEVQRCLAAGVSVNCKDGNGDTPLHRAAYSGHKEVAALLLGAGAAVDAVDEDGVNPLHRAAQYGHKEVAALLLGAGAAVDAADKWGATPLHRAAEKGHKEVAALLLGARAAVDAANKDDYTPLHYAAYFGRKEVAALLLGAGAAMDAAGKERKTPLYLAAKYGHKEVAALLLGAGAAVDAADKDGKTPADVCCTAASESNKANKGPILAALTAAAAARKAAPKQQQAVAVVPAPPAVKSPPRQPLAVPGVAAALPLYGGGTVTLAASAFKASVLSSELLKAGLKVALQVAGSVVTANPAGLIEAVTLLAQDLRNSREAVLWCKERAARAGDRAAALVPALQELEKAVLAPRRGVEVRLVESVTVILVLLAKVLMEIEQLLLQIGKSSKGGVMNRMLHFLSAQGFRQQFEEQEQELRDCLVQLSAVLNVMQVTSQARVADMVRQQVQQVDVWRQQNEQDQRVDMQQLEELMLQAVGGLEGLKQQLATQEGMLQGQAVGLEQVQRWLAEMHASSAVITGHLQRMHAKVEVIQGGVDDIKAGQDTLKAGQDALAAMVMEMFVSMKSGRAGIAKLRSGAPAQVIPKSSIHITEEALADAPSGAFGTVVRAVREGGGAVAVKLYNIRKAGVADQLDAIHEAALLNRASHNNVVRCFGVVHDPDSAKRSSIHGSLVMEWVGGGNLCEWLQENLETELRVRVQIARQVAAGLKHLHEQGLVHGDLKPQNVLLQFMQGEELPEVKICDFGLSKYSSSSISQSYRPTKAYTLEYTSPERLQEFTRSQQDDVYAFGILLYFIATSRTPFSNFSAHELKEAVIAGKRPDIRAWAATGSSSSRFAGRSQEVVQAYCNLAENCWHQEPEQRPGCDDILSRLSRLSQLQHA